MAQRQAGIELDRTAQERQGAVIVPDNQFVAAKNGVGAAILRIGAHGVTGQFRPGLHVPGLHPFRPVAPADAPGGLDEHLGILGLKSQGLFDQVPGDHGVMPGHPVEVPAALPDQGVHIPACRRPCGGPGLFGVVDLRRQNGGQVLEQGGEALVGQASGQVETLGPDDFCGFGIDHGDRQQEVLARGPESTFDDITRAEALPDGLGVLDVRAEVKAGGSGDHRQPAKAAQLVDQVLAQPFGGEVQRGIARLVLEPEDGHGRAALEPGCRLGQVENMPGQGREGRRRSFPGRQFGIQERPLFPEPVLEALLAGKVQSLQELGVGAG